jgi:hypothetical protein
MCFLLTFFSSVGRDWSVYLLGIKFQAEAAKPMAYNTLGKTYGLQHTGPIDISWLDWA